MNTLVNSVRQKAQEAAKKRAAALKQLRDEAREQAKVFFGEGTRELFAAHPTLESFGWRQYTPYFNDGETCEFGVHNDELVINGEDDAEFLAKELYKPTGETTTSTQWGRTVESPVYAYVANPNFDPTLKAAHDDARDFLRAFAEDDFKEMFGDHVEITVHRTGKVSIEEYSHE